MHLVFPLIIIHESNHHRKHITWTSHCKKWTFTGIEKMAVKYHKTQWDKKRVNETYIISLSGYHKNKNSTYIMTSISINKNIKHRCYTSIFMQKTHTNSVYKSFWMWMLSSSSIIIDFIFMVICSFFFIQPKWWKWLVSLGSFTYNIHIIT